MKNKNKASSWLAILILTGLGISVSPNQVLTRTAEVSRALSPVLSSYEVIRMAPGEIERQVRTTGELRFRFAGTDFHFNLKPNNLRAPNYRAVETGPGGVRRTLPPQPVRTFKGTLAGREDTRGRFNLTGRGIEGVVFAPEGLYYVEPLRNYLPSAPAGELVVYRQSDIKPSEARQCGASLPRRLQREVSRVATKTESDTLTNYVADVATEADYEYVQRLGGSAEANSDIEGILNVIAEVYQNELLVTLRLSFQHAWATAEDPYTATTSEEVESEFVAYWSANFAQEQDFDLAHIWSGKPTVSGSSRSRICTESRSADPNDPRLPDIAWGVASYSIGLAYRVTLPAHEMGHNFNATHTIDNNPPLPNCTSTVMGIVGAGLTFCQYSRDEIADHLANYNNCLDTQDITLQPPSDLSATAISSSAINLAWEDNSTDETGFSVQRRRQGSGDWVQIGTTAADTESYSHQGLFPESTYIYRVQAFNDTESSAFSKETDATTLAGPEVTTNWRIHTVAGGNIGDGGPATEAFLILPNKVAVDSSGNLYIAESHVHRIRKVDTSGTITTIAGTGVSGFSGDGGLATAAGLSSPTDVAVDSLGNLYIADSGNHRIRKVDTSGTITTIAGTGVSGFSGDGGPATAAELSSPEDVALDGSDNLYIADSNNNRLRKVDTSGTITSLVTILGGSTTGLAIDASGNVYISESRSDWVKKVDTSGTITIFAGTEGGSGFSGDGGAATAAELSSPTDVALDSSGNLYIADLGNHRIRKVDTSGTITTFAGTGKSGFSGDGGPATAARLDQPLGVAVDSSGNLYISELLNNRVRKVDTAGTISTVAGVGDSRFGGDGGPATRARLNNPTNVAVDSSGNLYIADSDNNRIRKVDTSGTITTFAGTGESSFSGDGGMATSARLARPGAVAVDGSGNLYIADSDNNRVRRVDSQGIITTVVTGVHSPRGMALDSSGNLYIAESHGHRIRRVDAMGIITTIAGTGASGFSGDGGPAIEARLRLPGDVAVDGLGNLYIADSFNQRIRRVDTSGTITTIAGIGSGIDSGGTGPATEAALRIPGGVAVDSSGNVYIADTVNGRIRKVDTSGTITTIAGTGQEGFSGDGGPAGEAQFNWPEGVTVDGAGKVYVADTRNHRVRVLTPGTAPPGGMDGPGDGEEEEETDEDPSDFTGADLEGRRLTLEETGGEDMAGSLRVRFLASNRFEAEDGKTSTRSGRYAYQKTGPGMGTLTLIYDDAVSCEIRLSFTESGVGAFAYDCGEGDAAEGSFRLTTGSLFVPVILSAAGQNQSFFTSELILTNRGERETRLDYTYTAHIGGGSGRASDVLAPGMQKIETDALVYLRGLGIAIPETGNRIGTLRVEVRLGSEVEAVVRTTTVVPEGRAGLAYPGVSEEEGFDEAVYLCGLRQNSRDRSNVAFQNMGAEEEGAITLRTTVYSGEAEDGTARVLEDIRLEPGGFHQYSGLLGVLESVEGDRQGYVKVERVKGTAPFYAYGVINDQANSDGSFVFPLPASSLEESTGQTLPVIVETSEFTSELTVTNFSEEARTLDFQFVAEGIETGDKAAGFGMTLEAGRQEIVTDLVDELRRLGVAGLGSTRGFYEGPLFAVAAEGDMSGIVIGARTGSEGGGGQYSVFYNAVPEGAAFTEVAWVDGLQQNEENRSNLALVNTGEVDGSASVFHLEIYDGETGLLAETVVTKPIPARRWHQINGILGSYAPETRQGYIRILKVSGGNPFLAYGVVNDGGAPGERSGDGAYVLARE